MSDPSLGPSALRGAVDLSGLVRAAQQPAPASSGAPVPGGVVREVDEQSFPAVLELSRTVPVIVEFYADGIAPALGPLVTSYGGRLLLVTIDGNRNPQLAQAFQIQQVPAVVALIGGRPVPLFLGMPSEQEVRGVLDQVLEAAAQSGVTGTVPLDGAADEPAEEPLPPLHQEAYDAI
ncbi:MAG: co-chaperone YbbN, partial [Yonghaparkia sp.]|nr:co-chaperone YbbN [Microcella sp.]